MLACEIPQSKMTMKTYLYPSVKICGKHRKIEFENADNCKLEYSIR